MSRRWLLGAGWVIAVTLGGAVLTARVPPALPAPPPASVAPPAPGAPGPTPDVAPEAPLKAPGQKGGAQAAAARPERPALPPGAVAAPPRQAQTVVSPAGQPAEGGGDVTQTAAARVAGVSYVLDILEKVSSVGPGVANGVAATVLSTALAGLPGSLDSQIVGAAGALAEQLSTQGTLTIERVRALVAQLSVANPAVSQALSLVAKALNDTSSPALSPLDQTANQLAEVLMSLAEPAATPSP